MSYRDFVVYFSLPFTPLKKRTFFYNGHIALCIKDRIYQIFNPKMLKSDFMVSVMPAQSWLYENFFNWVDREHDSPTYRYVSLYGKAETSRTHVYYLALRDVASTNLQQYEHYFAELDSRHRQGQVNFNFFTHNCASLLLPIFYQEKILIKGPVDFIPSYLFKKLVTTCVKQKRKIEFGRVKGAISDEFIVHRICIGLPTFLPTVYMHKWLKKQRDRYRKLTAY